METTAGLTLRVDSREALSASGDLDKLAAAGKRAEGAARAMSPAFATLNTSISKVGGDTGRIVSELNRLNASNKQISASLAKVNTQFGEFVAGLKEGIAAGKEQASASASVGRSYERVAGEARGAERGVRRVSDAAREQKREMGALEGVLKRYALAIGATFSIGKILQAADEWNTLSARVKTATGSVEGGTAAMYRLLDIANRTGKPLGEVADQFARTSDTLRQIGYTTEQSLATVEGLSLGFRVAGTNTEKSRAAIEAWTKSMMRGRLDLEGFTTIASATPDVIQALANSLGVSTAELYRMTAAGQVTADKMVRLGDNLDELRKKAEAMPGSINLAFATLQNNLIEFAGRTNESVGAASALAGALNLVAENVGTVVTVVSTLVALRVVAWLRSLMLAAGAASVALGGLATAATLAARAIPYIGWVIAALGAAATAYEVFRRKSGDANAESSDGARKVAEAQRAATQRIVHSLDEIIGKYAEVAKARDGALTSTTFFTDTEAGYQAALTRARELSKALAGSRVASLGVGGQTVQVGGDTLSVDDATRQLGALMGALGKRDDVLRQIQQRSLADFLADRRGLTEAQQRVEEVKKIRAAYDAAILGESDPVKIREAAQRRDRMIAEINKPRGGVKTPKQADTFLGFDLNVIRRDLDQVTSVYSAAEAVLEARRSAALVSEADYYAQKRALVEQNEQAQIKALQAENAAISAEEVTGARVLENQSKIADNLQKIAEIRVKAGASLQVLSIQERAASAKTVAAFNEAKAAAEAYLATVSKGYERERDAFGMGEAAKQFLEGRQRIEDRYEQQRQSAGRDHRRKQIDDQQYQDELDRIKDYQARELAVWSDHYQKLEILRRDGTLGAMRALNDYVVNAERVGDSIGEAFQKGFQQAEDAMVTFLRTGKIDFRSFANFVIDEINRILVKKMLANAAGDGKGGMGKIFGAAVSWITGLVGGGVGNTDIPGRLADGGYISGPGGPRDDSVPIMASPGEAVISAKSVKQWGRGFIDSVIAGPKIGQVPRFADGGHVGSSIPRPVMAMASGGIVAPQPVTTDSARPMTLNFYGVKDARGIERSGQQAAVRLAGIMHRSVRGI